MRNSCMTVSFLLRQATIWLLSISATMIGRLMCAQVTMLKCPYKLQHSSFCFQSSCLSNSYSCNCQTSSHSASASRIRSMSQTYAAIVLGNSPSSYSLPHEHESKLQQSAQWAFRNVPDITGVSCLTMRAKEIAYLDTILSLRNWHCSFRTIF